MVYILLADGFEEAEALVTADLLRRGGCAVTLVGLDDLQVTGAHHITVLADTTLAQVDADEIEMLVLPGGLGGVENIQMNLFALALIEAVRNRGAYVAAICAAPTILAHLGILDRRRAVCYPGMEDQMFSAVIQRDTPVVSDGRIITAEAAGSVFDFALRLVEVLKGIEAAQKVRHAIHYRG